MKNRHALNFVLATTLLSLTVLMVDTPFIRAIEWSSVNQLTTDPGWDGSPSIMQAENGTIWVVWTSNRILLNDELYYKTSSNYGLNWSPDTRLTEASGADSCPSIMQTSNGSIWVVWASYRTGNYDLFCKTFNGTGWSSDTPLTNDMDSDRDPSIMQASNGSIWVVWASDRNGNYTLFYKMYNGLGWSQEKNLTDSMSSDREPSIMQASNGSIWVVWASYRTDNFDLFCKTFNGTGWSSDTQLTDYPENDMAPSITQARDGMIWVVWQSPRAHAVQEDLYYMVYDGSDWSSETQLTSHEAYDMASSIAQTNDRKIWVVWAADRETNFDLHYKTTVVIPGDVNGDGIVDIYDLTLVDEAYGKVDGDSGYNPDADLNCDGVIDIYDLAECGKNYG